MKETGRRRLMVTSSLYEISVAQLGNTVVVRDGGVTPFTPGGYKEMTSILADQ